MGKYSRADYFCFEIKPASEPDYIGAAADVMNLRELSFQLYLTKHSLVGKGSIEIKLDKDLAKLAPRNFEKPIFAGIMVYHVAHNFISVRQRESELLKKMHLNEYPPRLQAIVENKILRQLKKKYGHFLFDNHSFSFVRKVGLKIRVPFSVAQAHSVLSRHIAKTKGAKMQPRRIAP